MFDKLKAIFAPKMTHRQYAPSHGMQSIFNHYSSDAYSSAYPSIRAIANEYMGIKPFAIDANGEPIQNHPIINALYHPNQLDSSVAFFEKIAVSTLYHKKTYLLVWRDEGGNARPGGNFYGTKGNNIAGFTFLEYPAVSRVDGKTYYNIGSQKFSEDEVIVLPGGVNPVSLYDGYSPSEASRRWATLDDYIADFQSGFFENGAVPAGLVSIVAGSEKEFNDIVDTIESRHKGAGKNGRVTYAHTPIDQTGKPAQAQITWTAFSEKNRDIGLADIFKQVNDKIDTAYGVPAIVKGIDDAATYANAQVAQAGFSKRAVYPLALRNYTQLNHELNRITGGTGIAITFKYDIPTISDEKKVEAERKAVEGQIIISMLNTGYSLDSIVDAFELSNAYKLLNKTSEPVIENDKPDVDEGNEVAGSPDPEEIDGTKPLNLRPTAELSDQQKIEAETIKFMEAQIGRVISELKETDAEPEADDKELDNYVEEMMLIITGILLAYGEDSYDTGIALAGLSVKELQGFNIADTTLDNYRAYLRRVGTTYSQDTAKSIRKVLENSVEQGLSRKDTEKALKEIVNIDDWRVKRLARTELNRSQAMGNLEGMLNLASETGLEFEKSLTHKGSSTVPCEFCQTYEGKWFSAETPFLAEGQMVIGVDGTIFVNDWIDYSAGDIHPNGKGAMLWRVKK